MFFVNQYIRPKYACPKCPDNGITTAALPNRPIYKGIAGPGLISHIIVSKIVDHIPLYRTEQIFKRYNIYFPRSTMDGWMAQSCLNLESIYREMHLWLVTNSFLVQGDETTLKVMDDTVKDKCALGYLWPFIGDNKLVMFEFRDSYAREGPTNFLTDFKNRYLMSDGYAGYNDVVMKNNLRHLICWAHVRRKFFESRDLDPTFCERMLSLIGKLYYVERDAATQKNFTVIQRYELRKEKSCPILEEIKKILDDPGTIILPKNKIGEAVTYTRNQWEQLVCFLEDGRLTIDNNLVENIIRPVALGRKNWLFAGSYEGVKRLSIYYSLVATCKLKEINPYEYFYNILPKFASYPSH